jgi:uncharacterized protein YjbI with pentapeptide repeats
MGSFRSEEILEKLQKGESLERSDLRDLTLDHSSLEGANLQRADLDGVNLEGSTLKKANLSCSNLREAYLAGANLEAANLEKANLEDANLEDANLQFADLSYANLEGATLEGANLKGARLHYAQLESANLGGALLEGAELAHADLSGSYLGAAKLIRANLRHARMEGANLEEADLSYASLTKAILHHACGEGANFTGALLGGAAWSNAVLARANLTMADLRHCDLLNAKMAGAILTGAKVFGIEAVPDQLGEVLAEWVDFSAEGTGQVKINGADLAEYYQRAKSGSLGISGGFSAQPKRFFGRGDLLRNATLEFSEDSEVEIESYFEKCTIALGPRAKLIIGFHGVLAGCQIVGTGEIVVLGSFHETGLSPGIVGPSRLVVGKTGTLVTAVQQPSTLTEFGFEHGCLLSLKILKAP